MLFSDVLLVFCRVSFRSVVVGLVAHQLLTQTIATLLLRDAPSLLEQERCFIAGSGTSPSTSPDDVTRLPGTLHIHIQSSDRNSRCLRSGLLPHLSCRNSLTLLDCLTSSARVASQFDARPGLKFLVQKVASTTVAANLYRQGARRTATRRAPMTSDSREE